MQTERQQEIISVAHRIINDQGIQGLTIKNLSRKIGVSEPALYRHFENKIAILEAILDDFKDLSYSMFHNAAANSGSPDEKISLLFRNHFNVFFSQPSLSSVIFSEEIFRNEQTLKSRISLIMDQNRSILTNIIKEGQENGAFRTDIDVSLLAIMTMGSLRLFVKKWQLSDFSFDIEQEGEKIVEMVNLLIAKI